MTKATLVVILWLSLISCIDIDFSAIAAPLKCTPRDPKTCAKIVYAAANQDRSLNISDIMSITYRGELSPFMSISNKAKKLSYEALARSFFDPQAGACPNGSHCTYDNIIRYIATSQFWLNAIRPDGSVNLTRLFGKNSSYKDYEQDLMAAIDSNKQDWYTGQSPNHASMWGNSVLEPLATSYPVDDNTLVAVITHVYDNGYTFGSQLRNGEIPVCTYVSVIITTKGRLKQGVSAC